MLVHVVAVSPRIIKKVIEYCLVSMIVRIVFDVACFSNVDKGVTIVVQKIGVYQKGHEFQE